MTTSIRAAAISTSCWARKLVEPPGECRNNHEVICRSRRAGRRRASGLCHDAARAHRLDAQEFEPPRPRGARGEQLGRRAAGFRDRAFPQRLRPSGRQVPLQAGLEERTLQGRASDPMVRSTTCRQCPIIGTSIEEATETYPFRLATSPARTFLNSTFNETPSSRKREGRPDRLRPSRRSAGARHRRWRQGEARQRARRGDPACQGLRRRAPRRADRRIDLAERGLRGRAGASTP